MYDKVPYGTGVNLISKKIPICFQHIQEHVWKLPEYTFIEPE